VTDAELIAAAEAELDYPFWRTLGRLAVAFVLLLVAWLATH
jgi:hypothetical protein